MSTWIYYAIYLIYSLIYSDIPQFILLQISYELIGGKLDLSQRIKTKQVFIVFDDWKEVTSVEEKEGTFFEQFFFKIIWTTDILMYSAIYTNCKV